MPSTKVNLSSKEMQMVQSEEVILMRLSVLSKVKALLEDCVPLVDSLIFPSLPEMVKKDVMHPKISKGEQYLQMPYMILDAPRIFAGNDVLAVRTMFLWANFFSVTLHVSGKYLDLYRDKLLNAPHFFNNSYYVSIHKDPWQHHFGDDNYVPLHSLKNWPSFVHEAAFIKLAVKFNLEKWEEMSDLLKESYQQTGSLLS